MSKKIVTKEQIRKYFDAWRDIHADRELSRSDINVLWTIQDMNFENFFASQNKLAEKLNYSQATISTAIKKLEKKGKIVITERPDQGSHKTLKIKLSEELQPFFSRENKASSYQNSNMTYQFSNMRTDKKSSLSYQFSNTNDINDTKLTILKNQDNPIKDDNTSGNTDLSLTRGKPISNFPDYFSVARDEVAKSGVTFTDTNFNYAVEMFKRSRKDKNQENLESWLLGSYLKESDKKTKQIGVYSTKGVITK